MKDGRWRAAVTVGKDAAGKPMRKVHTPATRHEVKDELTDALKLGIPIVSEKQTTGAFDTLAGPSHQTARSAKDAPHVFRSGEAHISPSLGAIPIGKLSPQGIREFLNAKPVAGLSPRTMKHLLVTLHGALEVAIKDGQIPRNVASLVDPPRTPRPKIRVFDPEQACAFLDVVKGSRLEAASTVAVCGKAAGGDSWFAMARR